MDELPALLRPFAGRWSIRRDIFDLDSQWTGQFKGQGDFVPRAAGLDYLEEGELRFAGLPPFSATRRYRWEAGDADILVEFDDGRFFHRFDPLESGAEAAHFCDPDLYEVRYLFDLPSEWRAEWRVEGPRKDYRMVTIYKR
ncbi:DUF6314 family protein [Pontivivens ytuae]|uniref:Trigger factor n=1 Tax=Pontivivens ytuae TaxID=2789856 RepID=A0A7S9QCA1_9RHOB|nr:DUF6314 family protein [Pontivivens ytuae]QPH53708.1 trigger factor [Pontivivens ytuae]